jgi:hypothetical protein
MAARFHRPLKVIAYNARGIWKQRYELSKQHEHLHIEFTLLSEIYFKTHVKAFVPNYHLSYRPHSGNERWNCCYC